MSMSKLEKFIISHSCDTMTKLSALSDLSLNKEKVEMVIKEFRKTKLGFSRDDNKIHIYETQEMNEDIDAFIDNCIAFESKELDKLIKKYCDK